MAFEWGSPPPQESPPRREGSPPPHRNTTPAEAGAQLGDGAELRCAPSLQPFQLGPGLRRGGRLARKGMSPSRFSRPATQRDLSATRQSHSQRRCQTSHHPRAKEAPRHTGIPPRRRPGPNWVGCGDDAQRQSATFPNWTPAFAWAGLWGVSFGRCGAKDVIRKTWFVRSEFGGRRSTPALVHGQLPPTQDQTAPAIQPRSSTPQATHRAPISRPCPTSPDHPR